MRALRLMALLGAVLAVLAAGAAPVLAGGPSPDPPASLTPFQDWTVDVAGEGFDIVKIMLVVMVGGWSLTLFALGIVAVAVSFRR